MEEKSEKKIEKKKFVLDTKKKQVITGVTALILVTLILVGLTYAYYRTRIIGNNSTDPSLSVTSKKLEIVYQDDSAVITATGIEPGYTVSKTFSVENTGDAAITYNIIIDNVINEFNKGVAERGAYNDWSYVLTKKGVSGEIASGAITTESVQKLAEQTIAGGVKDEFTLKITYANLTDVDQSADMGSRLSLRINITDIELENGDITLDGFDSDTLVYAINRNSNISTPLSQPAKAISLSNEAVLATTEDEYGTSYYYRGSVENNYVNFAGMCWRIVRIEGDYGIKLVLASADGTCDESGALTNDSAIMSGSEYNTFKTTMNSYASQLNSRQICLGDLTTKYDSGQEGWYGVYGDTCDEGDRSDESDGCYFTIYNYANYQRISVDREPSLKCGVNDSKSQASYVFSLTADEVVFAGGKDNNWNMHYYLSDNADGFWFTATPKGLGNDTQKGEIRYRVAPDGGLYYGSGNYYSNNFQEYDSDFKYRPAISLSKTATISDGTGTKTDPYVIG